MKITRLDLAGFKSYLGAHFDTNASRVFVAGLCGSGKTALRESIKWALTGKCQGTDARGSGVDLLRPMSAGGIDVALALDGVGMLSRTVPNGSGPVLKVEGWSGTSAVQQNALYAKLTTNPAYLDAVLDSGHFLSLHHAESKALVLALLNVRIKFGPADDAPVLSLDDLDALYAKHFEERKLAKAKLRTFHVPAAPTSEPRPTVEAVEGQLQKLRGVLEDSTRAIGSAVGQRAALQRQMEVAKVREMVTGAPPEDELVTQIADLEERLAIVEEGAVNDALMGSPATYPVANVSFLRTKVEALAAHKPSKGCVLDPDVPCKTPKQSFTVRVKALQTELEGQPAQAPPSPSKLSPAAALRHDLGILKENKALYDRVREVNTQRQKDLERLTKDLAALPETSTQETDIATLKGRIEKGEALLRDVRTHWQAVDASAKADQERQKLAADVERLEQLCETLGPNGVRVQALATELGKFHDAIAPYLAPFGWTIRFQLDPWDVVVNDRPVETYSKSERYRIGIALQLAIASLSGLSFAVVDEVDILDFANRNLLTGMLMQAPLEQIIVLATREPGQPLPPAMPGLVSYRIANQDGKSVITERSAA